MYCAAVQRRFLSHLETAPSATAAEGMLSKLDELGDQLKEAVERIPDHTVNEVIEAGADSTYGSSLILNRWARLLTSTYYDQRLCLLSYALSRPPGPQNMHDYHSQTIDSAISFLYKCARLSTDLFFRRYHWSWPGNCKPPRCLRHALTLYPSKFMQSSTTTRISSSPQHRAFYLRLRRRQANTQCSRSHFRTGQRELRSRWQHRCRESCPSLPEKRQRSLEIFKSASSSSLAQEELGSGQHIVTSAGYSALSELVSER